MADFEKTFDRNRVLFLFRLGKKFGNKSVFMDASEDLKEADKRDKKLGHAEGGPTMSLARYQAQAYADYVEGCVNPDTLHEFNTKRYRFFVKDEERGKGPKPGKRKDNVRANVSQ